METRAKGYDCIIVGAGVSGIAAAKRLSGRGYSVCLLDKSRGIGGRLATRRVEGARFDHGAQFFTARASEFQGLVEQWVQSGIARPWFGGPSHTRYCGVQNMNAVAKHFAGGLEVKRQEKVEELVRGESGWTVRTESGSFEGLSVLLTCPAPQAVALLSASRAKVCGAFTDTLNTIEYDMCISLMLLLKKELNLTESGILQLESEEPIATVTETSVKGTTNRPGIVIQSGPKFAEAHFSSAAEEILSELSSALPYEGELEVEGMSLQRWRFAKRRPHDLEQSFSKDTAQFLWHAGDGYLAPKIEGAIQSGWEAADSIIESLVAANRLPLVSGKK